MWNYFSLRQSPRDAFRLVGFISSVNYLNCVKFTFAQISFYTQIQGAFLLGFSQAIPLVSPNSKWSATQQTGFICTGQYFTVPAGEVLIFLLFSWLAAFHQTLLTSSPPTWRTWLRWSQLPSSTPTTATCLSIVAAKAPCASVTWGKRRCVTNTLNVSCTPIVSPALVLCATSALNCCCSHLPPSPSLHPSVFEEPEDPSARSFFSEIISSVSDVKFSHSGRYLLTRDYLTAKVWDLNMESKPLETYQVCAPPACSSSHKL